MKKNFFLMVLFVFGRGLWADSDLAQLPDLSNQESEAHICCSAMISSKKIKDILPYIDVQTLVICDLDGVLMEPLQTLGNDPWASYEIQKYNALLGDLSRGLEAFVPLWVDVQNNLAMRAVEPGLTDFFMQIQQNGAGVIGFTARGMMLADRTREQLAHVGVALDEMAWYACAVENKTFRYEHNILFAGTGLDKGDCLCSFFNAIGKWPKKVVFIDDNLKNVMSVQKMLSEKKVSFLGFHYCASKHHSEVFDKKIGELELFVFRQFGAIITDNQAEKIIQKIEQEVVKAKYDFEIAANVQTGSDKGACA